MLLREFPRLDVPSPERRAFLDAFGRENVVLHAVTEGCSYAEHPGPLSIKWTPRGRERYWIAGVPVVVESGARLVLDDHTRYGSEVEPGQTCETLTVFFGRGFAEQALAAAASAHERLLDDPERARGVRFVEHVSREPGPVQVALERLRSALTHQARDGMWLDELCHTLIEALLVEQRQLHGRALELSAVKRSTRLELYARVTRARDLILGCYHEPLRLRQLARAAAMSPHHFLRVFHDAFGTTPAQLLVRRRLEVAAEQLRASDLSIEQVASTVGFESHSAFSRSFRRAFGCSPSGYRARSGNPGPVR